MDKEIAMAMSKLDKENAVILALAHPLRRKILQRLEGNSNGGLSPKMLADEFGEKLPNVAYHVRCLVEVGALKLVDGKHRRGAIEHFYKRTESAIDKKATEVLELIKK